MNRQQLIDWCRERADANRSFNRPLDARDLGLIRNVWPGYFLEIASMLEGDGSTSMGAQP